MLPMLTSKELAFPEWCRSNGKKNYPFGYWEFKTICETTFSRWQEKILAWELTVSQNPLNQNLLSISKPKSKLTFFLVVNHPDLDNPLNAIYFLALVYVIWAGPLFWLWI